MELERRYIEKTDFQQARRGYDPAEVDRHLRAIATAVDELKLSRTQSSVANTTAGQVEAIVAAAEKSAHEIEEKAKADAQETRAKAERRAAEHVKSAEDLVGSLQARAQQLLSEVEAVVTRIGGIKTALDAISSDVATSPVSGSYETIAPDAEPPPGAFDEPAAESVAEPAAEPKSSSPEGEGARLIALNMALSGTPREETARYLQENFDLDDQDKLLDEVYAKAGS